MIRRWLALTYHLYALRLAVLSHFYFNRLYYGKPTRTVQTNMNPPRHPYLNLQQGNVESYCAIVPKKELPQWHAQGWLPHYAVGLYAVPPTAPMQPALFQVARRGAWATHAHPTLGLRSLNRNRVRAYRTHPTSGLKVLCGLRLLKHLKHYNLDNL